MSDQKPMTLREKIAREIVETMTKRLGFETVYADFTPSDDSYALTDRILALIQADHAIVPREPRPEQLKPLAVAWCKEHGIDPEAPAKPHGEWPNWYAHCGPYAEMYRTLIEAAPKVQP